MKIQSGLTLTLRKILETSLAVLKRLQGALKRLRRVYERAKTWILRDACFRNEFFELYDSATPFGCAFNGLKTYLGRLDTSFGTVETASMRFEAS